MAKERGLGYRGGCKWWRHVAREGVAVSEGLQWSCGGLALSSRKTKEGQDLYVL